MWLEGIFCCDLYDSSIAVLRRSGVGWTVNVGPPSGWATIIGLLAASVTSVVLVALLTQ